MRGAGFEMRDHRPGAPPVVGAACAAATLELLDQAPRQATLAAVDKTAKNRHALVQCSVFRLAVAPATERAEIGGDPVMALFADLTAIKDGSGRAGPSDGADHLDHSLDIGVKALVTMLDASDCQPDRSRVVVKRLEIQLLIGESAPRSVGKDCRDLAFLAQIPAAAPVGDVQFDEGLARWFIARRRACGLW